LNKKIKDLSERWTKDQIIIFLWDLLDNIDTTNDIVKDDNKSFREITNVIQSKRWGCGVYCDGNNLFANGEKIGL
jgi:hypothetical protein